MASRKKNRVLSILGMLLFAAGLAGWCAGFFLPVKGLRQVSLIAAILGLGMAAAIRG